MQCSELSTRSILMGCAIGVVFASGNVFTGLKIGFVDGGSLAAALLSFAIFSLLSPTRAYNKHEINISQTIAASAAIMGTVAGLSGPMAALDMLNRMPSTTVLFLWGLALAILGIGLAIWLREQLIVRDQLPFPTGTATAEIIQTAFLARSQTMRSAFLLLASILASAAITTLRDFPPHIIPSETTFTWPLIGVTSATVAIGIAWSPMISATGVLIGGRGSLSLVAGSVIAWIGLVPHVAHSKTNPVTDYSSAVSWLIWPSVALLLASSLTSLALQWRSVGRAVLTATRWKTRMSSSQLKTGLVAGSMTASGSLFVFVIAWVSFSMEPFIVLAILIGTYCLAIFCGRAAGETDIAPAGTVGTVGQFIGASPSSSSCLTGGAIPFGVSSQAAQMLWAFQAGQKLKTASTDLIVAQIIGSVVGIISAIPTYIVIRNVYSLGSTELPATSALTWKTTAEAIANGTSGIPESAMLPTAIAFALGITMTVLNEKNTIYKSWLPTPVALGIGAIMPATFAGGILFGTIGMFAAQRVFPQNARRLCLLMAAGGIAGESIAGVVIASLVSLNLF